MRQGREVMQLNDEIIIKMRTFFIARCNAHQNQEANMFVVFSSHLTDPCDWSMWLIHVTDPCGWSMWLIHVTDPCDWPMWLIHVTDPCDWSMWLTHVTDPCDWPMWLIHVTDLCEEAEDSTYIVHLWPESIELGHLNKTLQ